MAGALFGLGLSPQFGPDGLLARGALLYVYDANTSTPAITYADFALSSTQSWPLEADSAGRLPAFWVDDGSYRARLTTSAGVEIFDEQSITSIGASTGGESGSSSADTTTLIQAGDVIWNAATGTRSGFVRANGRTIGNGSSGATERANSDTQTLFEYLWNNLADAEAAVSTGRGASATADFNAGKTIALPDLRGRLLAGLDDMGTSAASRIAAGTPTTVGTTGGGETSTALIAHTHGSGTYTVATSITNGTNVWRSSQGEAEFTSPGGSDTWAFDGDPSQSTLSLANGDVSGSSSSSGSGTSFNKMPPYMLGTFYMKL